MKSGVQSNSNENLIELSHHRLVEKFAFSLQKNQPQRNRCAQFFPRDTKITRSQYLLSYQLTFTPFVAKTL